MDNTKHTPGPWKMCEIISNGCELGPEIYGPNDEWIATVCGAPYLGYGNTIPNARLIAAAPDMLAALEAIAAECEGIFAFETWIREVLGNTNVNCLRLRLDEARAAIAKARGK